MITIEKWAAIRQLNEQGYGKRTIARMLGVSRSTVKANLFFQLVSKRYKVSSIILTSNRTFDEWGSIFGDEVIAAAIIDRLVHHSHIFNINGRSFRVKDKLGKDHDKKCL